jgi:hypothetical protein
MGTGYTRNDTANNISDGNVINASDLDGEFDAIQGAFNGTTGHSHDGTSGEGPKIGTAGLADDAVTGAKIDSATTITAAGFTGPLTGNVTGNITGNVTGTASNAALLDNIDSSSFLRSDAADTKTSGNLSFSDNVKAQFGTGNDFEIFHDGSNTYLAESGGTGNVYLRGNNLVLLNNSNETYIHCVSDSAVNLYHNNALKLATSSTGVTITGTAVATSFTGSLTGNVTGNASTATTLQTARTIAGKSFNGSANITIASTDLSDSGSINASTLDNIDSTSFLRSDAADIATHHISFKNNETNNYDTIATSTGGLGAFEVYNFGVGNDAFFALHAAQDFGCYFGLDAGINDIAVGGWSFGANSYRVWHQGNDGSGSGLDADLLDGVNSASFLRSDAADTKTSGNLSFSDNVRAQFGASTDLQIYHNGSHSLIQETGTGDLYIASDTNVIISNSATSESKATFTTNGAVNLYYDNVAKLGTKADGVDITGELQADSLDIDGAADISGTLTMGGNIDMQDNDRLRLGSSVDLQLYHDGSNSYITDVGQGNLFVGGTNLYLIAGNGETYIGCVQDGGVNVYHNNAHTFGTEAAGLLVKANKHLRIENGNWSGNTNGKIQYHSNTMYVVGESFRYRNGGTDRVLFDGSGNGHFDGNVTAYSTSVSDPRLKEDIEPVTDALSKVEKLTGYTFTMKKDGKASAGVLSTEVKNVLPSAVQQSTMPLSHDSVTEEPDETLYDIVEYDQLHALLIEAIKELKAQVEELKNGSAN